MQLEIFTLCDAATDSDGKLNIIGTFDQISAMKFPCVYRRIVVALRIRFEPIEEGKHPVRVTFVNADGKPVIPPLNAEIGIGFGGGTHSVCRNVILELNGVKFDTPGQYSLDIAIDGRQERSVPLHVFLKSSAPPPASPAAPPPPSAAPSAPGA